MALQKLISATLAVTDIDEAAAFNIDVLGLNQIERDGDVIYLGRSSGDDLAQLVLTQGGTGVTSFIIGVDSSDELEQFEDRLARLSLTTQRRGDALPGHAEVLALALPTGQEVVLAPRPDAPVYVHAAESTSGPISDRGVAPIDIDHITIAFPDEATGKATARVLTDGLGFSISDIFLNAEDEWQGAWTRAGELHHDVGLMRCQPGATLHHLAWTVDNMEHHKRAADVLVRAGFDLEAPPGRHGVGGNLYSYLWTPGGNRYELSAEMPRLTGARGEPLVRRAGEFNAFSAWGAPRPDSFVRGS